MSQLLMFTYSCDCLIHESAAVAIAMYASPWPHLSMSESGRKLRQDSIMVLLRANVPCSMSACGFSTISLETYTAVINTRYR